MKTRVTSLPCPEELTDAFGRFDISTLLRFSADPELWDVERMAARKRLAMAAGCLLRQNPGGADRFLEDLPEDGSAGERDVLIVEALQAESAHAAPRVLEILEPVYSEEDGARGRHLRLMMARALVETGNFDRLDGVLKPLLEPPGVEQTLEAHFLELEVLFKLVPLEYQLIEKVTFLDVMMERGFRIAESARVLHFAMLLDKYRVEAILDVFLRAHGDFLNALETRQRSEIEFLIEAGAQHDIPQAVGAGARGFRKRPFPWQIGDPGSTASVLNSRGEHEAAEALIRETFNGEEIAEHPVLWSQLVFTLYYQDRWEEALEGLLPHRDQIDEVPIRLPLRIVEAVCLARTGKAGEALEKMEALGEDFLRESVDFEAAAKILALAAEDRFDDLEPEAKRILETRAGNQAFAGGFLNHAYTCLLQLGKDRAIDSWLVLLGKILARPQQIRRLAAAGMVAVQWGLPQGARTAAPLVEEMGDSARGALLRGMAAAEEGLEEEVARYFQVALDGADETLRDEALFQQAKAMRRLQRFEEAEEIVGGLLERPNRLVPYFPLALKAGILAERGRETEEVLERIGGYLNRQPEEARLRMEHVNQLMAGESPAAMLEEARRLRKKDPRNPAIVLFARRALKGFDATEPEKAEAARILRESGSGG